MGRRSRPTEPNHEKNISATIQYVADYNIARGDDGFEGKKVIEILLQIKGETIA